jgi:hypothetical protein
MIAEKYEIRKGKKSPCELWVTRDGLKWEFVVAGTHTYCYQIMRRLNG